MFYQGVLVTLLVVQLVPTTHGQSEADDAKPSTGDLCKADIQTEKLCRQCVQFDVGVTSVSDCCLDEAVLAQCKRHSAGRKRDVRDAGDVAYSPLVAPQMTQRARPFLGKRARYFLGKRLRNNFLGKRDGGSYQNAIPLVDLLQDNDEESYKRARPFLGKKARPFLGKRSGYYDDDDLQVDEEADLEPDKRARPFLGKRARRPFLGKRTRRPFLGKRDLDEEDNDGVDGAELVGEENEMDDKRARPFLGKRDDEEDFLTDVMAKRAARYMLGRRADETLAGMEQLANRRQYSLSKRSAHEAERDGQSKA